MTYWSDIKQLFSGVDIAYMRMLGWPIDDYNFVKNNRSSLLGALQRGSMPPKPFEQWDQAKVNTLSAWYDEGAPLLDSALQSSEADFIKLSVFLTGFAGLDQDPALAYGYHQRLLTEAGSVITADELDQLITDYANMSESDFIASTLQTLAPQAKVVILLWYTGSFFSEHGFPAASENAQRGYQYTQGLVWEAVQAHPMGYSTEANVNALGEGDKNGQSYWHYAPDDKGNFTGQGLKPPR